MNEEQQRKVFTTNLNNYIALSGKQQNEIAHDLGISPQRLNTWTQGIALPRIGAIQMLADYFGINKSDLIDSGHSSLVLTPIEEALIRAFRMCTHERQDIILELLGLKKGTEISELSNNVG